MDELALDELTLRFSSHSCLFPLSFPPHFWVASATSLKAASQMYLSNTDGTFDWSRDSHAFATVTQSDVLIQESSSLIRLTAGAFFSIQKLDDSGF